nr:glycosyltransferase [Sulfoacidibacillus ferrooxidans]
MRARLTGGKIKDPVLLYVGRLAPEKQLERLRPILDAIHPIHIAFVGDGPDRARLEHMFKHTQVHFLGLLHANELAAAFASADAFIFPSTTETLGLVLLEAMSSGLPIIAAKSKPSEELIRQTEAGILFDSEDQESLLHAVRSLLTQPDLHHQLATQARSSIELRGWEIPTKALVEYYQVAVRAHQLHHHSVTSDIDIPV